MSRLSGWLRGLAALLVCTTGLPVAAQQVTLTVHHFLSAGSIAHTQFIAPWCERIESQSAGRLKCQIFPAMQLGGTPEQLIDQANMGLADVVWAMPGYTPGRFPLVDVFELPFMMTNAEATSQAVWDYAAEYGREEFAGVRPLAFHVHAGGLFFMRDRAVTRMEDLAGATIRTPTRHASALLEALGAIPMSMPAPQVRELMAKGVVAGTLFPYEVVPSVRLNTLIRHASEGAPGFPKFQTSVFIFAINKARYDSLPEDLKRVLDANSGRELSARAGRIWDAAEMPVRDALIDDGLQVNIIAAAELERWQAASAHVSAAWVTDVTARGADGTALLQAARDLISHYSK
jgi:TRAP-type C4-dicarboxylate transport system substrate-binding protein